VDQLVGFQAGVVIGAEGQPAVGALGFGKLVEAPKYGLKSLRIIGADIRSEDQLVGFQAGVVIGAEGQPAVGALGFGKLGEAPKYGLKSLRIIGADIVHIWSKVHKEIKNQ